MITESDKSLRTIKTVSLIAYSGINQIRWLQTNCFPHRTFHATLTEWKTKVYQYYPFCTFRRSKSQGKKHAAKLFISCFLSCNLFFGWRYHTHFVLYFCSQKFFETKNLCKPYKKKDSVKKCDKSIAIFDHDDLESFSILAIQRQGIFKSLKLSSPCLSKMNAMFIFWR